MTQGQAPATRTVPDAKALERLRHDLHRVAEVAGEEQKTAATVRRFLAGHGLEPVADAVGGHGLLYRIEGKNGEGPRRLLRADLDALPLEERSGADHASAGGTHHACGHDGHMAMLAGAAAALRERPDFPGEVWLLFQPAEETGAGMARCLEDVALADAHFDQVFAIHNIPGIPLGEVRCRPGAMAVASAGLRIRFEGESSHAAEPDAGRSPMDAVVETIREVDACRDAVDDDPAALATVIHAWLGDGEAFGTSPGRGGVAFTLRARNDAQLEKMADHLRARATDLAKKEGLGLEMEEVEPFPATRNDPDAVATVQAAAEAVELPLVAPPQPFPWSEDFGHATTRWPGALIGLGAGQQQPALHRPEYDFPDELLPIGVRLWVALAGVPT